MQTQMKNEDSNITLLKYSQFERPCDYASFISGIESSTFQFSFQSYRKMLTQKGIIQQSIINMYKHSKEFFEIIFGKLFPNFHKQYQVKCDLDVNFVWNAKFIENLLFITTWIPSFSNTIMFVYERSHMRMKYQIKYNDSSHWKNSTHEIFLFFSAEYDSSRKNLPDLKISEVTLNICSDKKLRFHSSNKEYKCYQRY